MTVYETELPGVGRKYELDYDEGRLVVVVHHDGKRDVYRRSPETADATKLFGLTGEQARQLGTVLEGAYFQPVDLDSVEVPLGDAFIEWYELPADAPVTDDSLDEANVWAETGATVLAVQRGDETHPSPDPEFELRGGDVLVALGDRTEQAELERLLTLDR
jgi:TrkA domain protein